MFGIGAIVSTTRIFVLSDHLMFAHGLRSLLSQDPDLQLVGQETDIDRALEQIKVSQPDIVILDSSGPSMQKLDLKRILLARPGLKVIGLSLNSNNLYIYQATQKVVDSILDFKLAILQAPLLTDSNG